MHRINIILTEKQFRAEKVHLGSAFNSSNYIRIQQKNLNEGMLGLVLSIPAIIKLFRFCIEKGQEYWLKIFYKDLHKVIDHRTLTSLLDEDSIEDIVGEKDGGYTEKQAKKTFKVIKFLTRESDLATAAADSTSGVKTPHHHRSKEDKQKRKNRIELLGDSPITVVSEVLGALQHGLHHLYTSLSNLIGKASIEAFETIFGDIKDQDKKQKIIDVIGNLFFVALISYALFFSGGTAFGAMDGVKVLEIFAETCEICELAYGTTILIPAVKKLIDKTRELKDSFGDSVFLDCIEGLINGTSKKVGAFFKNVENSLNVEIQSSRFSPEVLSTKSKNKKADRSDKSQYDYYGNPIIDNYIRQYIDLFLS